MKFRLKTVVSAFIVCIGSSILAQNSQNEKLQWTIETNEDWEINNEEHSNLEFKDGMAVPTSKTATYKSKIKKYSKKKSVKSIIVEQSPVWENWESRSNIGPSNLGDAPILLRAADGNYLMFGRYNQSKKENNENFIAKDITIEGFDMTLKTTPFENQYDAPGGLKPKLGGYHAWQSRDMETWIHHGPVSENFSRWMTTAEYVDGKFYLYYDFPNDQDPHLYIDDNLEDGMPGKNMGMVFKDPTHGSDCAVIRDLNGEFHVITEDWSPINASKRSWDSPLAVHAVSPDGINDFNIKNPPVDYRTKPTDSIGTYKHPHWAKEDPKNYKTNVAEYQIHEPEQPAFGDWASISIGGQYYLFGDYDHKEGEPMSVCWFTSSDINEPFTFSGSIGEGHPDPDIMFAEGKFYLATQQDTDFISSGPWVENVELRVGVDTNNDGFANYWSNWNNVNESYSSVKYFAKQVSKTPASLDLSNLPEGYGFQFEIKITDTTENKSKPILDKVSIFFNEKI